MIRYFLARRNWADYNTDVNISFPFQEFAGCTPKDGDVGFEMNHEYNAVLDDCAYGVVKVSQNHAR